MKRKNTPWRPVTCERMHRGQVIWVGNLYSLAPKWVWTTRGAGCGRAATRLSAMRAAERAVDAALEKGEE